MSEAVSEKIVEVPKNLPCYMRAMWEYNNFTLTKTLDKNIQTVGNLVYRLSHTVP
jgi:hypothetical protein